ncbi:hypothetical protein [Streptomyces tauricus]|uniref:hypothetical protein n=1 Tax=Streptomyces tauricus TaxID=68274 RepID=UPI0022441D8B|nr:hypothetical protein [Streptomyces tauricus]MCW8101651.1 hypothetical protein [Streptomyces tauricus]
MFWGRFRGVIGCQQGMGPTSCAVSQPPWCTGLLQDHGLAPAAAFGVHGRIDRDRSLRPASDGGPVGAGGGAIGCGRLDLGGFAGAFGSLGFGQPARPLLDYLRTGTDAEQAGAERAWYCAHVPLHADRSPAYAPGGSRDPALDESRDVRDEWQETLRLSAK